MDAWIKMAESVMQSSMEVNRAILSSFSNGSTQEDQLSAIDTIAFEQQGWEFDQSIDNHTEITIGDTVTFSKILDEEDIQAFACVTGDTNRLHLDDEYAEATRFGGRIVHGTLMSGLISAALARLPGLTIYLSQDLAFHHPMQVGDRVTATVEVVEDLGDSQYRLSTTIINEDRNMTVLDGEAVVLIDDPPDL